MWIINHISYQTFISYHKQSFLKTQKCVKLKINNENCAEVLAYFTAEPPLHRHFSAFVLKYRHVYQNLLEKKKKKEKKKVGWLLRQFNQMPLKDKLSEFSLSRQSCHLRHERAAAMFGLHYILVVSTLWARDKHQERFLSVTALYGICKHYV